MQASAFFIYSIDNPVLLVKQGFLFCVASYDRIMNLSKHFCKALDSTEKLAIMVLALRNKEC